MVARRQASSADCGMPKGQPLAQAAPVQSHRFPPWPGYTAMHTLPPLHPSNADFAGIRRQGGFYVDKTGWFRDLLEAYPSTLSSP